MILYADGCSMTEGTELFSEAYPEYSKYTQLLLFSNDHISRLGYGHLAHYNKTHCFPALIAKAFDWELMNGALGGSGNELIAYRTIQNLTSLLELYPACEIVALINWTDVCRRFRVNNHGLSLFLPPHDNGTFYIPFENQYIRHLTTHNEHETVIGTMILHNAINCVESFCKRYGIKLLMTHSLAYHVSHYEIKNKWRVLNHFTSDYWQAFFDQYVSTENVYYFNCTTKPKNFKELIQVQNFGMYSYFAEVGGYPRCHFGHPGKDAHAGWAQTLIEEFKRRNFV